MEKIKLFLDSNVVFSIAYTGREKSRSYLIYQLQAAGFLTVHISNLVCAEVTHNIRNKKPDSEPLLKELIADSIVLADITSQLNNAVINNLPINDEIILTTAIGNRMDFFITGNERDFGVLYHKKTGDTIILKPVDFLNKNY